MSEAEHKDPDDMYAGPSDLLIDRMLLSLIAAQPRQEKSVLARLKIVTQAIFGRDPVIKVLPDDKYESAVGHMVQLLHVDAVKAQEVGSAYKRLSIAKAAEATQKMCFPNETHPHVVRKRLQDMYSGSHLNKNPDRLGEGGKTSSEQHKRSLFYKHIVDDLVEESMAYQQLRKIEAILKPWGTPMKID
jgi:hypothetical protein